MTIDELKKTGWIVAQVIVGSQSFGTATETSDIDRKGIYILPDSERMKYNPVLEVSDPKHDNVYWEVSKFLELLNAANPGALEVLYSPDKCIEKGKVFLERIRSDHSFITSKCLKSFSEYASKQIQRARGLNKKVFNPIDHKPRVLEYCYIVENPSDYRGAIPVEQWLTHNSYSDDQKWFSLSAINHFDNTYAVFYQKQPNWLWRLIHRFPVEHNWRWAYGIVRNEESSCDIQLNSIPKGACPVAYMYYNANAYSKACKQYADFLNWENERNPVRYAETIKHGQGYDAKNMAHCIRLLMTAVDIAEKKTVVVDRSDSRDFLLSIKRGEKSFDEVMTMGTELCNKATESFAKADLPEFEFETTEKLSEYLLYLLNLNRYGTFKT